MVSDARIGPFPFSPLLLRSLRIPGTELINEGLERWIPRWREDGGGDGAKLGGKVVREDGNEGKQAEMSIHT